MTTPKLSDELKGLALPFALRRIRQAHVTSYGEQATVELEKELSRNPFLASMVMASRLGSTTPTPAPRAALTAALAASPAPTPVDPQQAIKDAFDREADGNAKIEMLKQHPWLRTYQPSLERRLAIAKERAASLTK